MIIKLFAWICYQVYKFAYAVVKELDKLIDAGKK